MPLFDFVSPESIRQQTRAENAAQRSQALQQAAAGGASGLELALGGLFSGFTQGLGDAVFPSQEVQAAEQQQQVIQGIQEGLDLTTPEGIREAGARFQAAGQLDKAAEAAVMAAELDDKLATTAKKRQVKDDRTSFMKSLEAAGIERGSPEYIAKLREFVNNKAKGQVSKTDVKVFNQSEGQRRDEFLADIVDHSLIGMDAAIREGFDPASKKSAIIDALPGSNWFRTEAHQKFRASARPVIEAYLVKITGAAYSEVQQTGAVETYMPQPGDKPGIVKKKLADIGHFGRLLKKSAGVSRPEGAVGQSEDGFTAFGSTPGVSYRFK